MELVVALLTLYALQCVTRLPPGSVLFVRPLRRWRFQHGGGWRVMPPVPSATCVVGCRIPLVQRDGKLRGRGAVTWLSGGVPTGLPAFDPSSGAQISTRGALVRVGGRPFAQGLDAEQAAELATWLRQLARPDLDRKGCIERAVSESLRWDRLRDRLDRVQRESRWLRASADAYAVSLFAILPLALALLGDEAGLYRAWIPLAGLHLLTWIAFAVAHRRLYPTHTGSRVEALIAMGLYPPLLLRGHAALSAGALGRYHPAAVAAVVLEGSALRAFLRSELVLARAASQEPADPPIAAVEAAAIATLIESLGIAPDALLAPPPPTDPLVESYCPACHEEYRRRDGRCTDCGVALLPLAGPGA